MRFLYHTATVSGLSLLTTLAWAETGKAPDPLFQNDETLQVTITAPMTTLVKERSQEDYLPGVFRFIDADGTAIDLDLGIRTRGNFRHETCGFPPLRLNFKKSQTKGTLFDKQDKMKLVVHCEDSDRYEQLVLREFLAYRMFNVITDLSFRARLLRVTYIDSEKKRDEEVRYAFLIEHKDRLAKRLEKELLEVERTPVVSIQPQQLNLTSVFEFFIANTDFSPVAGGAGENCCHNYTLFGDESTSIVAIPYDFDQSGLVNAPYAGPGPSLRLRSVRQRLYRGRCVNNHRLPVSLQQFRDSHDDVYAVIDAQEGLTSSTHKNIVRYIDKFYELIDDPDDVERQFVNNCI